MSESMISNRKLRRNISASEKLAIVQSSYEPGVLVAEVARKYNVAVSSLVKWRKNALEGSLMSVKDNEFYIKFISVNSQDSKRIARFIEQLYACQISLGSLWIPGA